MGEYPDSGARVKREVKIQSDRLSSKGRIGIAHTLIAIFGLLVVIIFVFSCVGYQNYSAHFRKDVEKTLAVISDLKASEISQFIAERMADGNTLLGRPAFYNAVKHLIENPGDVKSAEFLREWLGRYAAHYQYSDILILDARGVEILSVPQKAGKVSTTLLKRLPEVLRAKNPELVDFLP